ncbi:MAG: thioredoxin domain-containing protein, partial [Planctomycetota bacterium]
MSDPHGTPNRLADETSPYLLQHRFNPVDWYPWGEEALAKARDTDTPIFLSIGYSACHWCHVMERESFESPAIAKLLNERFVCIKVDREERPDLDQIYMNAVVALTGQGGWPMSVFLTPELKPFYGGTYWPPTAKFGRPGFADVVVQVHTAYVDRRDAIETNADKLTLAIADMAAPTGVPVEL